jgi:oligopeptide transport system ATP-binding protein
MSILLEINDLKTHFFTHRGVIRAVDGISLSLDQGESLGIVGESGSGKSVTCLSILQLVPKPSGKITGGSILFEGEDLIRKNEREMQEIRRHKIAMIPQDSLTALDPVFSIWSQLSETIRTHRDHQKMDRQQVWDKARDLLSQVQLSSPEERLRSYPHELSGGMRQRVIGAMALAYRPRLIIADEPTSALDVTIQAQYLALLQEMRSRLNAGLIFVTHDLGIMEAICDRIAVMYAGKMVEEATVQTIFSQPAHPYTQALINAMPRLDQKLERLKAIEGQPPSLDSISPGCAFRPRCAANTSRCQDPPPLVKINDRHLVSCWEAV